MGSVGVGARMCVTGPKEHQAYEELEEDTEAKERLEDVENVVVGTG